MLPEGFEEASGRPFVFLGLCRGFRASCISGTVAASGLTSYIPGTAEERRDHLLEIIEPVSATVCYFFCFTFCFIVSYLFPDYFSLSQKGIFLNEPGKTHVEPELAKGSRKTILGQGRGHLGDGPGLARKDLGRLPQGRDCGGRDKTS